MNAAIAGWAAWRGGDPERPEAVGDAHWRRMGRLGRGVAWCGASVLAEHPEVGRDLPVIWGTALGEVDASSVFLDRLAAEGPARVSPLVFQGSVYNAAVARLSLAMGLRGPTETVAAGQASAVAALFRGAEWLVRAPAVLVIAGDELPWAARTAIEAAGAVPAEGAFAALLVRGDEVAFADGIEGPARFGRDRPLPYERAPLPAVDHADALCAVLPVVAWLEARAGTVVASDDGAVLSARWVR